MLLLVFYNWFLELWVFVVACILQLGEWRREGAVALPFLARRPAMPAKTLLACPLPHCLPLLSGLCASCPAVLGVLLQGGKVWADHWQRTQRKRHHGRCSSWQYLPAAARSACAHARHMPLGI